MYSAPADKYGVIHDARVDRTSRWRVALSIFVPLAGTLFGLGDWPAMVPSHTTSVVFVFFFSVTALGINIGLHRYFSHGTFKTSRTVKFLLATFGSFSMQGPISIWVADHRRHHRFTDAPGDPHSPYWIDERRLASVAAGFWHSHVAWMFRPGSTDVRRYASDVLGDPIAGWQSQHYGFMCFLALATPSALGLVLGGPAEGLRCFLWAGCLRVTVLHETTRAVNSVGHLFGSKQPGSKDGSRNNPWLFWLWLGEGLHSFHHRYPNATVNEPLLFDPVGQLLLGLQAVRIVWDVKRVSSNQAFTTELARK
jgi:stearoyl-CoA desaturase (delta-9 desaturase)